MELGISELKKIEFDILADIHEYCAANNITYFLWGGHYLEQSGIMVLFHGMMILISRCRGRIMFVS